MPARYTRAPRDPDPKPRGALRHRRSNFLHEYLDDRLAVDVRARLEHHLAGCADCATYLEAYRTTIELGRTAFAHPDEAVPSDVPEDLVQAILAARRRET